ncbi:MULTISPECIES: NUDIX hydrolase [unclassified Nocardia]|uniref:NUDIX domain-containing protein n=1 Tax=unclassified Nocardia TaxID=2637762 RepID=UPI0024A986F9|nr:MULTISPECIES: NUDIX hydrolase [unclassified Nocardia]
MSTEPVSRMAAPRVAAGAVIVRESSVLLVRPTYKDHWDIPGGYVEIGESPLDACRREIREELGITVRDLRFAAVDWAPDRAGDKLLFLFAAPELDGVDVARLRFPDGELAEARYVRLPDLERYTVPRLVRRIRATVRVFDSGRFPIYLENGE